MDFSVTVIRHIPKINSVENFLEISLSLAHVRFIFI